MYRQRHQQRAALVLQDVHYVIEAHFEMTDRATEADHPGKFADIMRRPAGKGQCYHQPYFGTREFPAHFRKWPGGEIPAIAETRDLGYMLYDMDYRQPQDIQPMFFRAALEKAYCKSPDVSGSMILQALTRHYEDLLALGEIQRPGWGLAKVSYGLQIDENGQILALLPLKVAREQGKKRRCGRRAAWRCPCRPNTQ